MSTAWRDHCEAYRKKHGCSLKQAMVESKTTYKKAEKKPAEKKAPVSKKVPVPKKEKKDKPSEVLVEKVEEPVVKPPKKRGRKQKENITEE